MIEPDLLGNPWVAIVLGVLAYAADHYTAIYEAHLYHAGVKTWLIYDGLYKLTPEYQAVITRQRIVSGRLLAILLMLAVGIYAAWWVLTQQLGRPDVFLLLMGGLILARVAEVSRQYRQIMFFREIRQRGGVQGRLILTRQLGLMRTVFDLYAFVMLYFLLFLLTGSWFLLGGALVCFVNSRQLRGWIAIKGLMKPSQRR
jgi:hypothetical protein